MNKKIQPNIINNDVIESLPFPLLIMDQFCRILFLNHQAKNFLTISRNNIQFYDLKYLFLDLEFFLLLIKQIKNSGRIVLKHEIKIKLKNNIYKEIELCLDLIENEENHFFLVVQDGLTFKIFKNLQSCLSIFQIEKNMLLMLAHEIKNLLSGIREVDQLLKQIVSLGDIELTYLICLEMDRIQVFLDNKIKNYQKQKLFTLLSIHEIFNHVVKSSKKSFASHILIQKLFDPFLLSIMVYKDALIQLFLILIKNVFETIDISGKKGKISVITKYQSSFMIKDLNNNQRLVLPLLINIQDNGVADLSDDIKDHLFDLFITIKENSIVVKSTIYKDIIQIHGGIIKIERHNNQTKFKILLPINYSH